MGKRSLWTDRQFYEEREKRKRLNPAWRGVGCLLIVALGVGAYFFSGWFLSSGLVYIPPELMRPSFATFLPDGAFLQIIISLIFMAFCYTILSMFYAIMFPKKLGETDAPPPKQRVRRKKR